MREQIVFGDRFVHAELPARTRRVSSGLVSVPLDPVQDLATAAREALSAPLGLPPLRELARGRRRVTVAFDDPTVPCYAPVWQTVLPIILQELEAGGVRRDDVTLLCANSLHRQFTHQELATVIGPELVAELGRQLVCHDAEDADLMEHLGLTPDGHDVEISRHVTESDLAVYLNASTTRGFSGGWKSICVGLSTYRSIRHHHNPDDMSMSLGRNRMHEILDAMGAVVTERLGPDRIFKVETVLANPLQVARFFAGDVDRVRAETLAIQRAISTPRRDLAPEKADVVLYGVPDWSPYAAFSFLNPILTLISTGLGYLGGMIEAAGAPGCSVILATPCPDRWDGVHHPSYREVWDRVLPETRDPYQARARYEEEFVSRADYLDKYRREFGFHPMHGIMALYPLKRLRHAGRVIVAGAQDPAVPRHLGFEPAESVEHALEMAFAAHGPDASVAYVPYPPAFNRRL